MIKKLAFMTLVSILICFTIGCGSAGDDKKSPEEISDIKTLINVKCSSCHFSDRIFNTPQPAVRWKDIVQRMRGRNPNMISLEEAKRITKYLRETNSIPDSGQGSFNEAAEDLEWE